MLLRPRWDEFVPPSRLSLDSRPLLWAERSFRPVSPQCRGPPLPGLETRGPSFLPVPAPVPRPLRLGRLIREPSRLPVPLLFFLARRVPALALAGLRPSWPTYPPCCAYSQAPASTSPTGLLLLPRSGWGHDAPLPLLPALPSARRIGTTRTCRSRHPAIHGRALRRRLYRRRLVTCRVARVNVGV